MDDTTDVAVDDKPSYVTKEDLDKFSDKLTSHFGRIVTKQFEEKYRPEIEKNKVDPEKLNEELSNKLFGGNVVETIEQVMDAREQRKTELHDKKIAAIENELVKYKDEPLYKETFAEAQKLAEAAIAKGFPPGPAAETAFAKAQSTYLMNKDPEYKLKMSGGGKSAPRKKQRALPPELKAAAQRDIADGLYKDEAEYINELSPSIREKYEI